MLNERVPFHGVMEGKGSYNRNAALPADGAALALPLLEKAIKRVELDSGNAPVVIADYGSSQGKNSMIPMASRDQEFKKTHRLKPPCSCVSYRPAVERLQLLVRGPSR